MKKSALFVFGLIAVLGLTARAESASEIHAEAHLSKTACYLTMVD